MRLLSLKEAGFDLDWFGVDPSGKIAHFASNGGIIPQSIENEKYEIVLDYFLSLPKISEKVYFNPNLKKYKNREWTIFEDMAERGLFSFDKLKGNNMGDPVYFLYAYPETCLTIANVQ